MLLERSTNVDNVDLNEILKKTVILITKTYRDFVSVSF